MANVIDRREVLLAGLTVGALASTSGRAGLSQRPTERLITVADGVRLRVQVREGRGHGAPVVLIPGWGMSAEVWSEQMTRLPNAHAAIAFDPRSQGGSTMVARGVTPEQRAEDLAALLQALDLDRPVLVGWSQGVQDIGAFVARHGASGLRGLVLVDAALSRGAGLIEQDPRTVSALLRMANLYLGSPEAYADGMLDAIITTRPHPAAAEQMRRSILATPSAIGYAAMMANALTRDRSSSLDGADCPILVVASSRSPDLGLQKSDASRLKSARFVEFADAGHAVFIDRPGRFADLLGSFVRTL